MEKKKFKIVILDDDRYFNLVLTAYVKTICNPAVYPQYDFVIESHKTASDWWENLDPETHVMFLDKYLLHPNDQLSLDGKDVLGFVRNSCDNCKVIMVTAHGSEEEAQELKNFGVYDYIDKTKNANSRVAVVLREILNEESTLDFPQT